MLARGRAGAQTRYIDSPLPFLSNSDNSFRKSNKARPESSIKLFPVGEANSAIACGAGGGGGHEAATGSVSLKSAHPEQSSIALSSGSIRFGIGDLLERLVRLDGLLREEVLL